MVMLGWAVQEREVKQQEAEGFHLMKKIKSMATYIRYW